MTQAEFNKLEVGDVIRGISGLGPRTIVEIIEFAKYKIERPDGSYAIAYTAGTWTLISRKSSVCI